MSSIRRFGVVSGVVAGAALLGACDLGGDGDGPPGGTVIVSAVKSGTTVYGSASAFFIARLDTSNGSQLSSYEQGLIPDLANDECEILESGSSTPEPTPEPIGLDVGSEVVLETGTASERIVLEAGFSEGYYSASSVENPAEGKAYSVTLEGTSEIPGQTWANALTLPAVLELDNFSSGTLSINAETGEDISWDAVGADAVVLQFQGSEAIGRCVTADDGSFKIPGEFAQDLGDSGYFSIMAVTESKQQLNGRTVTLGGMTGESGYFTVSGGTTNPAVTNCAIVWISPGTASGKVHAYIVDLPVADWTTGSKTFDGETRIGALLYDYSSGSIADQAIAASGTFELVVAGANTDDDVEFYDGSSQTYQSQAGATVAGGTGEFLGKLADPNAQQPAPGSGTVSIEYNGTLLTLGSQTRYAQCYDVNAVAAMTPAQKLARILASK